ncbi:hypothetical protein J2752_000536 [Halarchaeum rubridurum]|uniref:GNAT family acetyltransferase n=1 Tax=Halarchaeum rubridurum TaxID=489911 RepID=A0A830FV19_9EURY|nr:DUF5816 domain-containing protein [Halarchaeum rubridurum]MBP1953655.1 hypothetical protein [Halarchaeum rubridurum]GGM63667.1 hypothetical protein GCM10009017_12090 [Halarchaeum rubridurum]
MFEVETDDGTFYAAEDEGERGDEGAFLVVYRTPDRETRYGWYCTNCESVDNAMDAMGTIVCNVCGNYRKPDEWDAAHE